MLDNPRLRALEINEIMHEGRRYLLLRDPMRISRAVALVPVAWAPVLALCNGATPAHALGRTARALAPTHVSDAEVAELLQQLDEAAMLHNATFERKHAAARREWRRRTVRPLSHAGKVYPADAAALAAQFDAWLDAAVDVTPAAVDWAQPVGLLSPHIDYARGGSVYARVWKRAAQAARTADVVVILATDHNGDDPVTLTRVPYATPFGALPLDESVVAATERVVDGALGAGAAAAGELRHRREHSIELVLNWLHHVRCGAPVAVAPILVGGMGMLMQADSAPARGAPPARGALPAREAFYGALVAALQQATAGRRTLFVASGDLAHVGAVFGDPPLTDSARAGVLEDDERLLEPLLAGDAAGFFAEVRRVENANNVCGVAPIWLLLRALAGKEARAQVGAHRAGELLGYATCPADEEDASMVTVAGVYLG